MGLKHPFTSPKSEGIDATIVGPNEWNDDHTVTGDVAFGTHKITGLGDPGSAQDAATKNYVDGHGAAPATNAAALITAYSSFR